MMTQYTLILNVLDKFGYEFIAFVFNLFWQSSILLAAALMLVLLLRKSAAALRKMIVFSAFCALVVLPVLPYVIAYLDVPAHEIEIFPRYPDRVEHITVQSNTSYDIGSGENLAATADTRPLSSTAKNAEAAHPNSGGVQLFYPWALLAGVVLAGMAAMLVHVIRMKGKLHSIKMESHVLKDRKVLSVFENAARQCGLKSRAEIRVHSEAATPVTFGMVRPVIVIPEDFASGTTKPVMQSIALHESLHIKHNDVIMRFVLSVIRALYFYNPLAWICFETFTTLSELACDEEVVALTGDTVAYAEMLSTTAEKIMQSRTVSAMAAGMAFSKHIIVKRVESILSFSFDDAGVSHRKKIILLYGLVAGISLIGILITVSVFPISHSPDKRLEALLPAIMFEDTAAIGSAVQAQPSLLRLADDTGMTLAHYAAGYGTEDIAMLLIEYGIDINSHDNNGSTPLHVAAKQGDMTVSELLIEHGALLEAKDHKGRTPLDIALQNGKLCEAAMLADYGSESIFASAALNEGDRVESFIEENPNSINVRDNRGMTMLHYAVQYDHYRLSRMLIEYGADVNASRSDGETPLHLAAWDGHDSLAKLLLAFGAGVNAMNKFGLTPLAWARERDYVSLSRTLIEHGASDYSVEQNTGKTWQRFINHPYSDRAFLVHLIASGKRATIPFERWYISEVYYAPRSNGSDDLYIIQIGRAHDDEMERACSVVFDSGGTYYAVIHEPDFQRRLLEPEYNFNVEHLELLKRS